MSAPKVSIIIPTYNRAAFLPATLDSVLAQDYVEKEIIVVDDGSTDGTAEICGRYPLRYIHQENRGGCAARNAGVAASSGELLIFLDDDDLFAEGSVAQRVEHWVREPQYDFILGKVRRFTEEKTGEDAGRIHFIDDENAIQVLCLGSGMMTRRGFEEAGRFDESIRMGDSEEVDLWIRMREKGQRQKFIDAVCLYYRRHTGNATRQHDENIHGFMKVLHDAARRKKQMEALQNR